LRHEVFAHENEICLMFQDTAAKWGGKGNVADFALDVNSTCGDVILDARVTEAARPHLWKPKLLLARITRFGS
jgi:hypothetical protein